TEAHALVAPAILDDALDACERAPTDEEDVGGVDLDELLVRVLAATLRRDRPGGALEGLHERWLPAFPREGTRDPPLLRLARDLVDLADVDDARLVLLDVVVGGLDELQQDVLDVLTDISRFRESGCVRDRERDLQQSREGCGEVRLAATGWSDQQDVRFLE